VEFIFIWIIVVSTVLEMSRRVNTLVTIFRFMNNIRVTQGVHTDCYFRICWNLGVKHVLVEI
jgi:hypothetical protein